MSGISKLITQCTTKVHTARQILRSSIFLVRGRNPGTPQAGSGDSAPKTSPPVSNNSDKSPKQFKNSDTEIWTSPFLDFNRALVVSGPAEYVEGHMLICRGYVRMFWGIQLTVYTLNAAILAFFFPQFMFQICAVTFGLISVAGFSSLGVVRRQSVSICMFMDRQTGDLSLMVPTHGVRKNPAIFINIPPKCEAVSVVGVAEAASALTNPKLLLNNPTKYIDKANLKVISNEAIAAVLNKPPRKKGASKDFGLFLVDQEINLDSAFGKTNGLPVSFNELTRDAILEFAEKNSDLLEGSKIGKELLDLCRQ